MELSSHFLLLDLAENATFQVDKATIQVVERHLKVIFCLLTSFKFDLDEIGKRCFKRFHGTLKSFSSSWPAQNAN